MKSISRLLILPLLLLSIYSFAQPSDAQVKKDAVGNGSGVISFKVTKSTGTRQWNSDIGNWEYVRGVEVKRKSEYPGINLIVKGDVVYQYVGVGKYSYWKFRVLSNEYEGIPNPTAKEIQAFLATDWAKFYGYYYQKIIKLHQEPSLADNPSWIWHTPNSVEFKMKLKFDHIISNTEVETLEAIWNVRLYRDDPKAAWKSFMAFMTNNDPEKKIYGVQKYTYEQIRDLEKQTLAFTMAEQQSKEQLAALPKVNLPVFTDPEEMAKYIHNILRNGTPDEFKAVMMQLLGPGFFTEGSTTQLRPGMEDILNRVITDAYKNKATYKQMYCQQPPVRIEKWANGQGKSVYLSAAITNSTTYFIIGQTNMGYVDGVPQTKLKIGEFGIHVRQDADAINFVNSFSDRRKLCPND
jgi:hypothetical protein